MAFGSYKPEQQCGNNYCKRYLFPSNPYPRVFGSYFPYLPGTTFTTLISEFLSEAGIANVYWGTGAWFVLGLPKVGEDTQFIVPDGLLDLAARTLMVKAYMPVCPHAHKCPIMKGRNSVVPDLHFHINHNDACLTLELFAKSRLVPALPELSLEVPSMDNPTFTLASNFQDYRTRRISAPGLGRFGNRRVPFHEAGHAVQILTPAAAVDALVYLCLRYFGEGPHWVTWADGLFGLGVLYSDVPKYERHTPTSLSTLGHSCAQSGESRDCAYKNDYFSVANRNEVLVEK